jgi:hypothetical protein
MLERPESWTDLEAGTTTNGKQPPRLQLPSAYTRTDTDTDNLGALFNGLIYGTFNPGDIFSKGHIVQGMHHPMDPIV